MALQGDASATGVTLHSCLCARRLQPNGCRTALPDQADRECARQITGDVEDAGGKSEEGSCEEEKKSAMKREQARVERRQEERKPRNDTAISSAVAALLSLHTEPGAA